uniref:chloroplast enveloppe membrane protein n=1 Tax=Klebsormidium subtilissimum TaxID=184584 RepID=UPI00286C800A|nr:chloroplast enveloppe membrane protein [Klebsormidium subtilissimum]WKT08102.1 chloroplast enveloppe membrane protein [Klebsormidium subtilissimum]
MSKVQMGLSVLRGWVIRFLDQELEIACMAVRQIQEIEKVYIRYQDAPHLTYDQFQTLKLYLNTSQEQALDEMEQSLLNFERLFLFRTEQKQFTFQNKLWFIEGIVWEINQSTKTPQQQLKITGLTADEPIGLIPRSIARTFSRLQTELDSYAEPLLMQEFKLIRYQAIASFQFFGHLLFFPWLSQTIFKIFFFKPILSHWWNTGQRQLFLNSFQEQKALEELQKLEDTAWLDLLMAYSSEVPLSLFINTIHERALQLVASTNEYSIQALVQLCTDGIFVCTLLLLLAFSKKKLSLAQMRAVGIKRSYLTDTMKAFLILLFTDLLIGFHSPHGWEILIESFMTYLGFAPNQYIVSLFVSTFPVIVDTVFKYWIFRHLNRVSPSIVVTYHTMSE